MSRIELIRGDITSFQIQSWDYILSVLTAWVTSEPEISLVISHMLVELSYIPHAPHELDSNS